VEALDHTVWRTHFGRSYGPLIRQGYRVYVCMVCTKITLKCTENWMFCSSVCNSVKTFDKLSVTDMH
jgi:hypothetical protein